MAVAIILVLDVFEAVCFWWKFVDFLIFFLE